MDRTIHCGIMRLEPAGLRFMHSGSKEIVRVIGFEGGKLFLVDH